MRIPSIPLATRATPITPDDKSTALTIATWLLLITFLIMFLSREAIKFVVLRKFALDDLLILLATIFAVGLSVTFLILASHGLGVHEELRLSRANTLMKGYYASDFLYILSICFAKLSLVTFFYSILVQRAQRRVVQLLGLFIAIWTLTSLFAVAFQCGLPRPWEVMALHCYNSGVFWIVYCIIDMSTDLSIIMLSVNLVAYLQVKFSRKLIVVACFAPRLFVMGAALARLIYLFPITPHNNPAFNLWVPVICTQLQVCLSISTACIPYMKPFFEGVEAGVWRADDLKRKGMKVRDHYAYGRSTISTRTHKKGKDFASADSTAAASLMRYGVTPDVSPRIPTPVPLSPILPPRLLTPPNANFNSSRSLSERGLRVHIPTFEIRPATEIISPQTASSYALSPECLSPQPLLSPSSPSSPIRTPTPPSRAHSPQPSVSSFHYSPDPNGKSPQTGSLAIFSQRPTARYSLIPPISKTPSPVPPFIAPRSKKRNKKRISVHQVSPNTSHPRDPIPNPKFPPRTSSMAQGYLPREQRKDSKMPEPGYSGFNYAVPPTHSSDITHTQSIGTPPSIPSYYLRTPPMENPPTFSAQNPSSPQRVRNQRIPTPQNSSRVEQISPVSPKTQTPLTFWRDETSSESAGASSAGPSASSPWQSERPWEREPMPIVRDLRNSPRIIVQSSP